MYCVRTYMTSAKRAGGLIELRFRRYRGKGAGSFEYLDVPF